MKQGGGIYVKLLQGGVRGVMHSGLLCKERSCSMDIFLTAGRITQSPNKKTQVAVSKYPSHAPENVLTSFMLKDLVGVVSSISEILGSPPKPPLTSVPSRGSDDDRGFVDIQVSF
jgi:hypothetical protein